ncbi:MAG: transposase [Micromonosporaceae bacterium]
MDEIPGIGPVAAAVIIAKIGVDMSHSPTAQHLASWAKFTPGMKESAGKRQEDRQGLHRARQLLPGPHPRRSRSGRRQADTFLGERYRRIARRRGKKKAIAAVGRSILVII